MEVHKTIEIDLTKYGMDGVAVMAKPTFSKTVAMRNALGNCTKTHIVNGKPVIDETSLGDVNVIETLAYVKEAPFRTDLKGFLGYCDVVDMKDIGAAERLFDEMSKAVEELKGYSPFANSQEAVTEISASESSQTASSTEPFQTTE